MTKPYPVLLVQAAFECLAQMPLLAVAMGAAVVMGLADLAANPAILSTSLGDTDDAARLIEVRALLSGQGWFDMRMPGFGGAVPLISHWSRIIDLPLAAMIALLTPVVGQEAAETATRIIWPTLMSGVIAFVIAHFCERNANRQTALLALALAVPCTGHFQFLPGRIDHHNVMIIGAVGGMFALLASLDRPRAGWLAGFLLGLGCAVGFEGLGMTLAGIAIVSLSVIGSGGSLAGLARAGIAFASALLAGFMLFGPGHPDGLIVCDALSINLILLAMCGAAGLACAHQARKAGQPAGQVFAIAATAGAIGVALYGYVQPQCLGGPYAQIEPRLGPVWLDTVSEVRSLFAVAQVSLSDALSFAGYPVIALGYGWLVVRGRMMPQAHVYFAIFIVTLLLGLWQVRLLPYASFLSVPLIAIGLFRERATPAHAKPVSYAGPSWGFASGAVAVIAGLAAIVLVLLPARPQAAQPVSSAASADAPTFTSCTSRTNVAALAQLPAGLAANDNVLGSYLVLWTRLSVLSAPYHRMGRSILETHDLMHAPAAQAPQRMKALGVRYIVLCEGVPDTVSLDPPESALRQALLAGHVPAGLESVQVSRGPLKVWRLVD